MLIRPYDRNSLRAQFAAASPFPHVAIEGFLEERFAQEVAAAYPSFERAQAIGRKFKAVNEVEKVQVTDSSLFPASVARLNEALSSPAFLADLEYITGIPRLLADAQLHGGGIHMTGPRGRLDVHVDFNFIAERALHRRLNLLLYLNPTWDPQWGGAVELWDEAVAKRHHAFEPVMNRAVMFETSERSFHGVSPVTCPPGMTRNSFAVYYYTREAPPDYRGVNHSTVFKARPDEKLRKYVLMPAERARETLRGTRRKVRAVKNRIKGILDSD